VRPVKRLNVAARDAVAVGLDDKGGELVVRVGTFGVGAGDPEDVMRLSCQRNPHFFTVDDVRITVAFGGGDHAGDIAADTRLGESKHGVFFALRLRDEEGLFLFLGAPADQHRRDDPRHQFVADNVLGREFHLRDALDAVEQPGGLGQSRGLSGRQVDLRGIAGAVDLHWTRDGRLVVSLEEVKAELQPSSDRDPETGAPYTYEALGADRYRLCATFNRASPTESCTPRGDFWSHGAGRHCFELEARKIER